MRRFESYENGYNTDYYENGSYVGFSSPGIVSGTTHYYDASGRYIGQEVDGLFGARHFTSVGGDRYDSYDGLVSNRNYYHDGEYVGSSFDMPFGENTFFEDE